jgi:hypothetical protein
MGIFTGESLHGLKAAGIIHWYFSGFTDDQIRKPGDWKAQSLAACYLQIHDLEEVVKKSLRGAGDDAWDLYDQWRSTVDTPQ